MTIWFVSRHLGALDWMQREGIAYDHHVTHLDPDDIQPGDTVVGSLPINLVAAVCERGASYISLSVRLGAADRGHELSANDLIRCGATLEEYYVRRMP